MPDGTKKADAPGLALTPRLLIVGAITLAGWLWFYYQDEPLGPAPTMVLAVAALLFFELVRAVPYARILRTLQAKPKQHDAGRHRRRAH